jgi:hypothetical protein
LCINVNPVTPRTVEAVGEVVTRCRKLVVTGSCRAKREVNGMKIIKLASPESGERRKLLVARLAQLFLEMFDVMQEIEQLRQDQRESDPSN